MSRVRFQNVLLVALGLVVFGLVIWTSLRLESAMVPPRTVPRTPKREITASARARTLLSSAVVASPPQSAQTDRPPPSSQMTTPQPIRTPVFDEAAYDAALQLLEANSSLASTQQHGVLEHIAACLRRYDANVRDDASAASASDPALARVWSASNYPVFSTMCIGVDCFKAEEQFATLSSSVGVGYFVFVLNARDRALHERYAVYHRAFPGRFILKDPGQKLSCAESWNVILRVAFEQLPDADTIPFIVVANADLFITQKRHSVWLRWMHEDNAARLRKFPIVIYAEFSFFAYTRLGWNALGTFDENLFPAYGEDVEMSFRAASLGLYPFPSFPDWRAYHSHVGSMSIRDTEVSKRIRRCDRIDYLRRKWGVDLFCCGDAWQTFVRRGYEVFSHPFGLQHVPHRHGWALDKEHRQCILTGRGQRIRSTGPVEHAELLEPDGGCWFNASTMFDKFPRPLGGGRDLVLYDRVIAAVDRMPDSTPALVKIIRRWAFPWI